MNLVPLLTQRQNLYMKPAIYEYDIETKIMDMLAFWLGHDHINISIELKEGKFEAEFVIAPVSFIRQIEKKEKYGIYCGGMVFVSEEIYKNHPNWVPYIALKAVFYGKETDGSEVDIHWRSLEKAIKLAEITMSSEEYQEFLAAIRNDERTGYFEAGARTKEIMAVSKSSGDNGNAVRRLREAKEKYLENHHHNKWVRIARISEDLRSISVLSRGESFNHAESIYRLLMADGRTCSNAYLAASFIKFLLQLGEGDTVELDADLSPIAYVLTKECNGLADLVFFDDSTFALGKNKIMVNVKRQRTLKALETRLLYGLMETKRRIYPLLDKCKAEFGSQVLKTDNVKSEIAVAMERLSRLVSMPAISDDAALILGSIGGWENELQEIKRSQVLLSDTAADLGAMVLIIDHAILPVENDRVLAHIAG